MMWDSSHQYRRESLIAVNSRIERFFVIPAKAGIQGLWASAGAPCSSQGQALDPRFREGDGYAGVNLGRTRPMTVAGELAEFLTRAGPADLPQQAVDHAAMLIASTFASAALGAGIESSVVIRDLARERGGIAEASLWFDAGPKLPVADAAQVNAVMSAAAASADSHPPNLLHPPTPLVPPPHSPAAPHAS